MDNHLDASYSPNFYCQVEWPSNNQIGLNSLDTFLTSHPEIRLVVIDTLAKIRPKAHGNSNAYFQDYGALQPLISLAHKHHICLLLIHHFRKMSAEDPYDEVSGSTGLTGAADSILLLQRKRNQIYAKLQLTGRDVEEQELTLVWDKESCRWTAQREDAANDLSPERQEIIDLLRKAPAAMKPSEVADTLDKKRENIKTLMHNMKLAGQIRPVVNGRYTTPDRGPVDIPITDFSNNDDDGDNPDYHDNPDDRPINDDGPVTTVIGNRPMPPDATRREGHPKDQEG
jgi:hypothetical protein